MIVIDEHDQKHEIAEQLVEEMRARGLIWEEGCSLRVREADTDMFQRQWLAMCDFCLGRPVCFDADCKDFAIADMTEDGPYISKGGWACCETCGSLIEANDRAGLLARQADRNPIMRMVFVIVHRRFWQNFIGIKRILPKRL